MRKPTVDYSGFKLKKINDSQFAHLKLLLGWVGYFFMYFLTENLIPAENCTPVHCFIDDLIPFCEVFVIPYVGWYALIVFSLLYFLLYNVDNFKRLQVFIIVTQVVAVIIYVLYPNRQDLRPLQFERDNIFTDVVGWLYSVDTNTGVCPSLHCAYSIGIASIWLKERSASKGFKWFIVIFAITICLSTMFIKQHSAVDFFVALPVCLLAEYVSCRFYWKEKFKKTAV